MRGAIAAAAAIPVGWRSGGDGLLAALRARLARDLAVEADSGRLILWLPAAFALGILIYFAAPQEPHRLAAPVLLALLAAGAVAARAHAVAFGALLVLASIAAGFSAGSVRTALVFHDITVPPAHAVTLTGYVERLERRVGGDRILLRLDDATRSRGVRGLDPVPELVRLTLRKGYAPPVGSRITQLARLLPPLEPAMPGAHDFGRGIWFRGIGAVGYGLGRPKPAPTAGELPLSVRAAMAVDDLREGLAGRIRASLSGVPAEIAVALVAGDRAGIPLAVEDSMRTSGLTHILSISGLHMALVAGTLFTIVRGALALVPALALGWPIKSIAAGVALAGSAVYLVLSGNDVPAQRSFVMAAVVLAGVLVGRPALTLRTVAVAAVVVLALTPEAALEPGTQMSFAATLALVAGYERLRPLRAIRRPDGLAARTLVTIGIFFGGIALTALIAGLASTPYGAFHFQRLAPYALIANLVAMPAVSLLVMPFGLIAVLLIPFGFDALAWPVMGFGIEIMVRVSDWIVALPNADMRAHGVNAAAVCAFSLALLMACLLRGLLSACALVPLAAALVLAGPPPRPDILIAPDAQTVAVRGLDGRLSILNARSQRLTAEQWLTREGDSRTAAAPGLAAAFSCDPSGCIAPLPAGGRIAVSRKAESLEADCLNADLVVTRDIPPGNCPAQTITPDQLGRTGTLALFKTGDGWRTEPARPAQVARPWIPPRPAELEMPDLSAPQAAVEDASAE